VVRIYRLEGLLCAHRESRIPTESRTPNTPAAPARGPRNPLALRSRSTEDAPVPSHPFHSDAVRALIRLALEEDAVGNDATSLALVGPEVQATAALEVRAPGVLCGLPLLEQDSILLAAFPSVRVEPLAKEGHVFSALGDAAMLRGNAREILGLERTLLNFLQRLSGIATLTARCVAELAGTGTLVQETRKTCPGWRSLDKYAVRVGGGVNHRHSLADQVLIKDNHITLSGDRMSPEACARAVRTARERWPNLAIEIEVETEAQWDAVLASAPDIVMLDGFSAEAIARCVAKRNALHGGPIIEVSGGLQLGQLRAIADLGVDRVSIGALTHSVVALDLALKLRQESS